jgi:hypothetical protein
MQFDLHPRLEQNWKKACRLAWEQIDENCDTKLRFTDWEHFWHVWVNNESFPERACGADLFSSIIEDEDETVAVAEVAVEVKK